MAHFHHEHNLRFNRSSHPIIRYQQTLDYIGSHDGVRVDWTENVQAELERRTLLDEFVDRLKRSTEYCVELLKSKSDKYQLESKCLSHRSSHMLSGKIKAKDEGIDIDSLDCRDSQQVMKFCVCSKEHSLAMQEYIENSSETETACIILAISNNLSSLSKDMLGNHVIQKLVRKSPELLSRFMRLTLTN